MQYPWPARDGSINYISAAPSTQWRENTRSIAMLGSTGSIGVSALEVIRQNAHLFEVVALSGAFNVQRLAEQATEFRPAYLAVYDKAGADLLRKLVRSLAGNDYKPEIVYGNEGYASIAELSAVNTVLSAQVGAAGLYGTMAAAKAGKVICLANKESLVLAGSLLRHVCAKSGAVILPVDSEHNALFQMLAGRPSAHVKKLVLTASGGPFRNKTKAELEHVTLQEALAHPNWNMGAKITIDSATLMNKGLEVIEAFHLYGLKAEQLGVVVHPQSIIHSLVEFQDNSYMAHLGTPDMRMPISHCIAWPHCVDSGVAPLDLLTMGDLSFTKPNVDAFPCLGLAEKAMRLGQDACVVLNAANEVAVELFLDGRIEFLQIAQLVRRALQSIEGQEPASVWNDLDKVSSVLEHIQLLDIQTRRQTRELAHKQE